jgi:hypothetical protein
LPNVERARIAFLDKEPAPPTGGTLYRALRDEVGARFVAIAPGDGYAVVHEDGEPEGAGGVVLIEPFEVPPADDDRFLAAWREAHATLAAQRGYLGTRLYRRVAGKGLRWVEVARWSSPLMVARAEAEGTLYLPQ